MTATAQPLAGRRRMPRRRCGYTTSVTIGNADFYLTANPNEDGSLGEIFIKFGKQGSTLGGLLDAVSISVSIGLQSGVPLQTFVSKYINMRFEPFGITDDPDLSSQCWTTSSDAWPSTSSTPTHAANSASTAWTTKPDN